MREGVAGDHSAARRAQEKADPQKKRFDFVLERVGGNVEAVTQSRDPGRASAEGVDERGEIATILRFEAQVVDLLQLESLAGRLWRDPPVQSALGIVACPAEQIVGLARRAAAALRDFTDGLFGDLGAEL